MEISEDKIEELKDLFKCDAHSWHYARVEVMRNILPEIFKLNFEKGKYYKVSNKDLIFYVKAKSTDEKLWGYGLEVDLVNYEKTKFLKDTYIPWTLERESAEEITKEKFLEQIMKYAVEVLGFKKGTVINVGNIYPNNKWVIDETILGEVYMNLGTEDEDHIKAPLQYGFATTVFLNGKFAKKIEQPKEKYETVSVSFTKEMFDILISSLKETDSGKNIDFSETTEIIIKNKNYDNKI